MGAGEVEGAQSEFLTAAELREQFARLAAAARGDDDVLRALVHVGHWRTGHPDRHEHLSDLRAGDLVVGAQHGATLAGRGRERPGLTGDDQRLGDQGTDATDPAGPRNVEALQVGMLPHVVRGLTVSDLPQDVARLEIDRADSSPWWLHD